MQMALRIWLAVLPQLDPSLISASLPLIQCPFSFPPLSSFFSPHYYCQNPLIMKYCYCVTAKIGHGGGLVGWGAGWLGGLRGQDCGTANHTEGGKNEGRWWCFGEGGGAVGDLGFQLRQTLQRCHLNYH